MPDRKPQVFTSQALPGGSVRVLAGPAELCSPLPQDTDLEGIIGNFYNLSMDKQSSLNNLVLEI
jgi:hypothetical protein